MEKRLTSIEAAQRPLLMQVADMQIANTERLTKIERRLRDLEHGLAMMAAAGGSEGKMNRPDRCGGGIWLNR
jgi:hypothetical protein